MLPVLVSPVELVEPELLVKLVEPVKLVVLVDPLGILPLVVLVVPVEPNVGSRLPLVVLVDRVVFVVAVVPVVLFVDPLEYVVSVIAVVLVELVV